MGVETDQRGLLEQGLVEVRRFICEMCNVQWYRMSIRGVTPLSLATLHRVLLAGLSFTSSGTRLNERYAKKRKSQRTSTSIGSARRIQNNITTFTIRR